MSRRDRELYGLQMLRAIAAFAVIVRHTLEMSYGSAGRFTPPWIAKSGGAGVDLFFVISGFIMVYVSFPPGRLPDSPKDFMVKRATRIFPLYWICSVAIVAISAVGFLRNRHIESSTILNSVFLLPGDKLVFVAWTLSYEIYFYLIFAICLAIGKMPFTSISAMIVMILGVVFGGRIQNPIFADFVSSPLVLEFCFGIVLAVLFCAGAQWRVPAVVGALGFLAIIVASIVAVSPEGLSEASRVIFWGLPAALIVAAFLNVDRPRSRLGRAAVLLGDASYALYLTHIFVMLGYGWLIKSTFVGGVSQVPFVPAIISICIIVGVLTHLLMEKPILEFIRKTLKRQRSRGPLEAGNLPS
ncbi:MULTISPECIES: acyltransferase [unclassified Mesorhizobium]|uniref:acyltransferase family protein n=1 Tax=unclassified Mesorhizobium TaxID=325217 RepID=UPI0013ED9970|nr:MULTISPECIES: acyltransferase [unclassified Mesorhizobium]